MERRFLIMPGDVTHYIFGREVYHNLKNNSLKKNLYYNRAAYGLGLQGPDIFFYYLPSYVLEGHNIGALAHVRETSAFFQGLIESRNQFSSRTDLNIAEAYLIGFLGHYTLDTICHPYIYAMTHYKDKKENAYFSRHAYLETDIDTALLDLKLHRQPCNFHTEDTILYAACFDANGGVFEPLFTEEDAIISDALNHASIIDGVRLCKAKRYRYANADMEELERCLQEAQAQRFRIIVTDGVFSMDGNVAPMDKICDLAEKYNALVMVDECHSAGVVGPKGRGVSELYNLYGRIVIHTGTLGKAFGGAIGGFTTGRKEIIDMLRQRSRPYLFSNSLPPAVVGAGIEVFKMLDESDELHTRLMENVTYFRDKMLAAGFDIKPTQSAICAVMLYDAKLSQSFAAQMLDEGIYVTGFYYPVVPQGQARIRVQLSAAHKKEELDACIKAFIKVGKNLGVLK